VFSLTSMTFGLSTLVSTGMIMAFYEWLRKAELSADRAALLLLDDLDPVLHSMMRLSGGSARYGHELNLEEFIRQSERYQRLDQDGLNQVYKFFLYNNVSGGTFLTHPFTVERVKFLRDWASSEDYRQIRTGNYCHTGAGAVEVSAAPPTDPEEVDRLRQELEDLQRQIDTLRRSQDED
jgi:Peptidase family M48